MKPKQKKMNHCQVCNVGEFKYCCPRCEIRFCSVECCREHKRASGCNGERDRTKFVPLREFTDEALHSGATSISVNVFWLLFQFARALCCCSDFRFLSEVAGVADRADRDVAKRSKVSRLTRSQQLIVSESLKRGISLKFMQAGAAHACRCRSSLTSPSSSSSS